MEKETFYWLFSASAQSIAAFIAFLLTGYALVINMMQSAQQNDPSIEDLHLTMKEKYYSHLLRVGILSGVAVILNLLCLSLNDFDYPCEVLVKIITTSVTVAAISYGIVFIIIIVDPKKYTKAANKIIDDLKGGEEQVDASQFFTEFIKLEKKIRDYLQSNDLYITDKRDVNMKYSVNKMVTALYKNKKIGFYAYDKLLTLNKYRNAIFHGHTDKVSKYMIDDLRIVNNEIDQYLKN